MILEAIGVVEPIVLPYLAFPVVRCELSVPWAGCCLLDLAKEVAECGTWWRGPDRVQATEDMILAIVERMVRRLGL